MGLLLLSIVEQDVEATVDGDDHGCQNPVSMARAGFPAWNIVEVINSFDVKGNVPVPLQEGEIPPMILDLGEFNQFAVIKAHWSGFHIRRSKLSPCPRGSRGGNGASRDTLGPNHPST